jgi:hypothetical protein
VIMIMGIRLTQVHHCRDHGGRPPVAIVIMS